MRQLDSFGLGFIKVRAVQQHFAAEAAHRIDFDIRRGGWHDDQRLHARARSRESHALRMITRRSGNHAMRFCSSVSPAIIAYAPRSLKLCTG